MLQADHLPDSSVNVDATPSQPPRATQETANDECYGLSGDGDSAVANVQALSHFLLGPGRPSPTPTASRRSAEEESESESLPVEDGSSAQSRRSTPQTAISRGSFANMNHAEGWINIGRTRIRCSASEDDQNEDGDSPPPTKRRRMRSRPVVSPSIPLTRSRLRQSSQMRSLPKEITDTMNHLSCESSASLPPEAVQLGDLTEAITETHPAHSEATRAEYQEWPFQGMVKCVDIGNEKILNLEFSLPCGLADACLPLAALRPPSSTPNPSHQMAHRGGITRMDLSSYDSRSRGDRWTAEEDDIVRNMRQRRCSWDEIQTKLPHRSKGAIQVRYSTKLK